MIEHVWSVLCVRSVIDKDSNLMTLIDVFEELSVEVAEAVQSGPEGMRTVPPEELPSIELPTIPVTMELVSLWVRRDPNERELGTVRLMLEAPGRGPSPFGKPFDVDLSAESRRLRTRTRISGMPARESGRYTIAVQLQQPGQDSWDEVARVPLDIVIKFPSIASE